MASGLIKNCVNFAFVAVFGFFGLTSKASAEEAIAVDAANPPFMYIANNKASGIYPALVEEIFKRIGTPAKISALPWKRALSLLDDGEVAVAGIYKSEERLKKYDYTDVLFNERLQIFVPKGKAFPFAGVDSLKGKSVGVIAGWSYGDAFDAARASGEIKVEEVAGDALNLKKLAVGRIDVVLAIKESAAVAMAGEDIGGKVDVIAEAFSNSPAFIAFSKKANKGDLIVKINATLAAMKQDGAYDKIVSSALAH